MFQEIITLLVAIVMSLGLSVRNDLNLPFESVERTSEIEISEEFEVDGQKEALGEKEDQNPGEVQNESDPEQEQNDQAENTTKVEAQNTQSSKDIPAPVTYVVIEKSKALEFISDEESMSEENEQEITAASILNVTPIKPIIPKPVIGEQIQDTTQVNANDSRVLNATSTVRY